MRGRRGKPRCARIDVGPAPRRKAFCFFGFSSAFFSHLDAARSDSFKCKVNLKAAMNALRGLASIEECAIELDLLGPPPSPRPCAVDA
jgi:hypothetical protein